MSMTYKCPSCNNNNQIDQIKVVANTTNHTPSWKCHLAACGVLSARAAWDALPANGAAGDKPKEVFIYEGAARGLQNPLFKLGREKSRDAIFNAFESVDRLRDPAYHPVMKITDLTSGGNTVGTSTDVAIYHRKEQFMLRGQYFVTNSQQHSDKVVLMLAGSGGVGAEHFKKVIPRYLGRVGVNVLMMDYRGFGRSDPKCISAAGLFTDARAMFNYLTSSKDLGGRNFAADQVIIHGYSLGTGVAADLARANKADIAGLVLQCPWQSGGKMSAQGGRAFAKGLGAPGFLGAAAGRLGSLGNTMDVEDKISGIGKPILLLIANQDEDMRSHGEAIQSKYQNRVGMHLTVGTYDGAHLEPENAFKVGGRIAVSSYSGKEYANSPVAGVGQTVKKDLTQNDSGANTKTSKGLGCLGVIQTYYSAL